MILFTKKKSCNSPQSIRFIWKMNKYWNDSRQLDGNFLLPSKIFFAFFLDNFFNYTLKYEIIKYVLSFNDKIRGRWILMHKKLNIIASKIAFIVHYVYHQTQFMPKFRATIIFRIKKKQTIFETEIYYWISPLIKLLEAGTYMSIICRNTYLSSLSSDILT